MSVNNTMDRACTLSNLSGIVAVTSGSPSPAKSAWIRLLIHITLSNLRSKRILAAHSVILAPCHQPYNFSSNSRILSLSLCHFSKKRNHSLRVSFLTSQCSRISTPRPLKTLKRPCSFSNQLMSARSLSIKSWTRDCPPLTIRGSCKSTMRDASIWGRTAPPTSWASPSWSGSRNSAISTTVMLLSPQRTLTRHQYLPHLVRMAPACQMSDIFRISRPDWSSCVET